MGIEELAAALRRKGEESCAAIREVAETEMAQLRSGWAEELAAMVEESAAKSARECHGVRERDTAMTRQQVQRLVLEAEAVMAMRLRTLAERLLTRLRGDRYEELFTAMAAALPAADWVAVRVNPADRELAQRLFPGKEIVVEPGITGGLEVATAHGTMTVCDTLDKRLERQWQDLLPKLMGRVYDVALDKSAGAD